MLFGVITRAALLALAFALPTDQDFSSEMKLAGLDQQSASGCVVDSSFNVLLMMQADLHNATFDDLPAKPFEQYMSIGRYKGLAFKNMQTAAFGVCNSALTGLHAQSGKHVAGSGLSAAVQKCLHETQSSNSTIETEISTSASCKLKVTGFKSTRKVTLQTFDFTGAGAVQPMVKATMDPAFKGLNRVEFATEALASTVIATLYENFEYTIHTP